MLSAKVEEKAVYWLVRKNMKRLRAKHQLTQTAVADKMGITVQYYQQMESGARIPQMKTIAKMCQIFNVHPSYFFYDENLQLISKDGQILAESLSSEEVAIIKNTASLTAEDQNSIMEYIRFKKFESMYGEDK